MSGQNLLLWYLQSCVDGKLGPSECGPVWQVSVIAILLVAAVMALIVLRLRARAQPAG